MQEIDKIISDIRQQKYVPIYFLSGNEPYFINQIVNELSLILDEEQKEFNFTSLYGNEVKIPDIISQSKRYPMMCDYQLIIVKEAQHLSATIEQLVSYASEPVPSTILVLAYKHKALDKKKTLYKAIKKNGVVLETKRLYERDVFSWVQKELKMLKIVMQADAMALLIDSLGTDIGRIKQELDKLKIAVSNQEITTQDIERHIGISKEFNNFELKKAIGIRDIQKAYRIIKYFENDPKNNPIVVTISMVYSFFVQLLQYHGLSDKSSVNVSKHLGINPYFVKEYQSAARYYTMKHCSLMIHRIKMIDLKSKGVGSGQLSQGNLLKELLISLSV